MPHVVVGQSPADLWPPTAAGVEAVLRGVRDHEHAAGVVHGEGVADRLPRAPEAEEPPVALIERAHDALVARHEPEPSLPVGQRRVELLVRGQHAAQVEGLDSAPLAVLEGNDEDLPGDRDDCAVLVVEVEVGAAGSLEGGQPRRDDTIGQLVLGDRVERPWVHQPQVDLAGRDAGGDQTAAAVEGDRDPARAQPDRAAEELREGACAPPQRTRGAVCVGLVGVVVDVGAPIRRHEGMARDARPPDGPRGRRAAAERIEAGELGGILRDRRCRGGARGRGERAAGQNQDGP